MTAQQEARLTEALANVSKPSVYLAGNSSMLSTAGDAMYQSDMIRLAGGVDIVLTHSSPQGIGDASDYAHQGFAAFLDFIDTYHPTYFLHGHMHLNYATGLGREEEYHGTKIINCCERYVLDWEDPPKTVLSDRFYPKLCRAMTKNLEIVKYY